MVVRTGKKASKSSTKAAADAPKVKAEPKEEEPQEEEESEEEEESDEENESEEESDKSSKKRKAKGKEGENKKSNSQSSAAGAPAAQPTTPSSNRGNNNNRNMAFDKGTYIFRLSDLDLDPVKDCVWRVDNHQLLQRYNPEKPEEKEGGKPRKYKRTQNYTGWMCQEGWDYIKLEVTGMYRNQGKEEEVTVRYPKQDQIDQQKETQKKKKEEQGNNDN